MALDKAAVAAVERLARQLRQGMGSDIRTLDATITARLLLSAWPDRVAAQRELLRDAAAGAVVALEDQSVTWAQQRELDLLLPAHWIEQAHVRDGHAGQAA